MHEVTVSIDGSWADVYRAAMFTRGKDVFDKPSDGWIYQILLAEHSPIRTINYHIAFKKIPSYVATHLSRHNAGVEKFVESQRSKVRSSLAQDAPVNMLMVANAQAVINISRKRLCNKSDLTTIEVWQKVKKILESDPIGAVCVPECVYRGFCPEFKPCGWQASKEFYDEIKKYRGLI